MRLKNVLIHLSVCLTSLFLHLACGRCGRDSKKVAKYYSIADLSVSATNNNGNENDTIQYDSFILDVSFGKRYFSSSSKPLRFISSAYACSPAEPGYLGSFEVIDSIVITSNNDLDSVYTAGTNLSSRFKYYQNNKTKVEPLTYNELLCEARERLPYEINLQLKNRPITTQTHQFKVEMFINSSRSVSDLANPAAIR
jgi:hypothetical protein